MSNQHRELCRKQHRILGNFLAVIAWTNDLDCIAVDREFLNKLLGIWQIRDVRIGWLREDIAAWFPHIQLYYYRRTTVASMFASRVQMSGLRSDRAMTDAERIAKMPPGSPKAATLAQLMSKRNVRDKIPRTQRGRTKSWEYSKVEGKKVRWPSEPDITAYLALLSSGLRDP